MIAMISNTIAILSLLAGNAYANEPVDPHLHLESAAFGNHQAIPVLYSCHGKNISVPLQWKNAPIETETFALIMKDPDAPSGTWYHWVLYNIPPQVTELHENESKLIRSEEIGQNSWGHNRYEGPCPPSGKHHYIFTLYALNASITLPGQATAADLEHAIKGHVIESATLTGTYKTKR